LRRNDVRSGERARGGFDEGSLIFPDANLGAGLAVKNSESRIQNSEFRKDPARFDPWAPRRFSGLRWLAASSLLHAGLLLLFATISITVVRTMEKIQVKIVQNEALEPEPLDGAPSLEDLAGLLDVAPAPMQRARTAGPIVRNVRPPRMPRIGGIGPKLGRGTTVDVSATNLSFGSGAIGGLGGSFGDYVGGLRKTGLDLVLVVDTTDSMQFVINEVKTRLASLITAIQSMVPTSRVGIVVYRDHGDEYVTKWADLSFRTAKLRDFLANVTAAGGGDWEEAVLDGLDSAINEMSWRKKSKRIIILVGGSPPHPQDLAEIQRAVAAFRAAGGSLNTIDVTQHLHAAFERVMWHSVHGDEPFHPSPLPDFYQLVTDVYGQLAQQGGGELIQLAEEKRLIREVLVLTFGSRWKVEMAKHLKELM
jgi:hypothetical protein